ncbi:MAG: glucose-1-phosphate cytidylyltransferase [Opitutales bacterium]|nr:glucose-1-phosphate cytidylyltransferase [Opitutales bacterium]
MKAVILAGGLGTRLSEETTLKPKPMVEIGGRPILWHIMKLYSYFGITEFIICAGYKGYLIKEYFANYFVHTSDVTFNLKTHEIVVHKKGAENWKVTVIDTGIHSMTGGRLKRVREYLDDETFFFTYGDGVGNIDINASLDAHRKAGRIGTLTAVQPPSRFGALHIDEDRITSFQEKPEGDGAWINGGFFVLEPSVFDYIESDLTVWERSPLETLVNEKQLTVFKHRGFWAPMDTMRDKLLLNDLWDDDQAPWKLWK